MTMNMKKSVKRKLAWLLTLVMCIGVIMPASIVSAGAAETGSVCFTESAGWFESVYAEWNPVSDAQAYNVYVKRAEETDENYVRLDKQLVRKYQGENGSCYYRADALGLAAGNYVLKVVPVVGEQEKQELATVTGTLKASAYDRTGFAWVNGESNGAYNADGTLKSNAVILYITENTKDTVTLDVVTNSKGSVTTSTGLQEILNSFKKGYDKRPVAIRLIGQVKDPAVTDKGDIIIDSVAGGVTLEGVGEDATADGWGIRLKNISNVEIRNIGIMNVDSGEGDNVGLQQDNDHIWVHNCDFFYGHAGSDKDQVKGDGALDCKKSTYVTFSYNHFYDNGKCNLLGLSEGTTSGLYITYHHNWYDHSDSRHPRVRYYSAHVYNNYYDGNAKYGVGSTLGSSVFVEGNYFRNCKFPILTSMQGSDVVSDWSTLTRDVTNLATFSKEAGGTIKAFNNHIEGAQTFVTYQECQTEFDAYEVKSADEKVPDTVKSYVGGNTYNNFDTSDIMYSYTADSPEQAKANVENYAGRMNGGDFKWTFNNAVDDESYEVNAELKAAVTSYKTSLLEVAPGNSEGIDQPGGSTEQPTTGSGGEATTGSGSETQPTTGGGSGTVPAGSTVHNFTENGTSSSFYSITGNLADKGTVTYAGMTLTKCLKMESSTDITFTAPADGKLLLVFGGSTSAAGKKVKLNGTAYVVGNDQTITLDIKAGANTIKKGESIFLYYMAFTTEGGTVTEPTTGAEEPTTGTEPTKPETPTQPENPTKPTKPSNTEYDKMSTKYAGAYTSLSILTEEQFNEKVYVSPDGKATGAGTKEDPIDLETAITNAVAEKAIILLGGTYAYDHQITIPLGNNGSENCYKILRAADGAKVTLDFSSQIYGDTATNPRGLQMEGDYWYVYGITVYGAADNGIFVAGKHNIVENCVLQANRDSGLQISRRASSVTNFEDWPAYNYIINCTAFDNCDPATGENADGFASKLTCGEGNVFDGCISYCNCDDGWDLYAKPATGSIGTVTLRNCIAFNNGTLTNGNSEANGDMNGFKLGGSNGACPTPHVVINCLAFNNGKDGFTDNGNGGSLTMLNCTSYNNAKTNFNFYRTTAGGSFFNLLTASAKNTDKFIGKIGNSIYYNGGNYYTVEASESGTSVTNGQKIGTKSSTNPFNDGAFVSTTEPKITTDIHSTMRNSDGTVTTNGYLMSTGKYESMGAHFNTEVQLLKVKANVTESKTDTGMVTDETTGKKYWYDDGVMAADKQVYDPETDAWYWFDADGTMAVNKDVFVPESNENRGKGKWVRYDENGSMIKGEDYRYGGWYYFDKITGEMAKGLYKNSENGSLYYYDNVTGQMVHGAVVIDGVNYAFDDETGKAVDCSWYAVDGIGYWYEDGVRQGTEGRGKEIYDPETNAWYWLDSIDGGKKAVGKDVYQESWAGEDADRPDGTGKWVRYDENGNMIKGWNEVNGNKYYFDLVTGAMKKGIKVIDGKEYRFNEVTGILEE